MPGVQVDLVLGAVQPEPDSAFSLAAVEVIDEKGLYLLGLTAAPFLPLVRCISVDNRGPAEV